MSGNLVAIGLLMGAYIFSVIRFVGITVQNHSAEDPGDDGKRIVRVTHWQLEPGFREAMDWAIDQYNQLPHVKAANVEVRQLPITERVYNQFMNVHLISGTAPDIAARGVTRLTRGTGTARFYTPLGGYVNDPNPYNAREFLPKHLSPETEKILTEGAWSDTFLDGMEGGFVTDLQDYFAVPVAIWGGLRIFYNLDLLARVKAFAAAAVESSEQPNWVRQAWLRKEDGKTFGFLPDSAAFRQWLASDQPPETLGQLLFYCTAVQAFAQAEGLSNLVPISGSNYGAGDLPALYFAPWANYRRTELDWDNDHQVSDIETFAGWQKGKWSFADEPLRQYFEFAKIVTGFFPRGYLGLDREQAQRRFVSGKAAMISSGAWDAGAIFNSVRTRRDGGFPIGITPPPYPAPGERWFEFIPLAPSEANFTSGVPLAINRASPNFDWALDFLRFISSMPVNQELNRRAGWLPAIAGAEPNPEMKPFMPKLTGIDRRGAPDFGSGLVRTVFSGQSKILLSGDISYQEFMSRMDAALNNPRHGAEAYWRLVLQRAQDRTLSDEATLSAVRVRQKFLHHPQAEKSFYNWIADRLPHDQGRRIRWFRHDLFPDQPLPAQP